MRFLSPLLVSRALFFVWSQSVEYGRERSSSSFLCHHHHAPCRRRRRKRRRKAWSSRRPSTFRLSVRLVFVESSWSSLVGIALYNGFVFVRSVVDFDERKRRKGGRSSFAKERKASIVDWMVVVVVVSLAFFTRVKRGVDADPSSSSFKSSSGLLN